MPRAPYHHGNLRRALLDAALAIVDHEGASALTLREAARRAGVSHAAPLRHFADKRALTVALAEEAMAGMRDELVAALRKTRTPRSRLRAVMLAYFRWAERYPARFELVTGPSLQKSASPGLQQVAIETFSLMKEVVASCAPKSLPILEQRRRVVVVWSAVHGLAALTLANQIAPSVPRPLEALAVEMADTLFAGWSARD